MKKLSSWRTFFGGVPRLGTVLAVSYISFTSTEHQIFTLQNGTGFKYKCNGLRIETFQGRPFPNQEGCEGERLIEFLSDATSSTREKLNQFVTAVNYSGPFIYLGNFRYFFSKVYIEGNGLCISVHYKPTDSHIYLLYSSSHPSHVKNSIPYSQFLRLRRLCDGSDFSLKSEEMCVFSTNVAILLLLFKRAIIAPDKLIGSQHYKRHRRKIMIEFPFTSHFALTTTQ